jgi:small subunit ribosomal protein S8
MPVSDPIADLLTRLRNAATAGAEVTVIPYSNIKAEIVRILDEQDYIASYRTEGEGINKHLVVELADGPQAISALVRVSKPGRRVYAGRGELPTVLSGQGMVIVSTSGGVMTGQDARKKGLGGEVLCKVW